MTAPTDIFCDAAELRDDAARAAKAIAVRVEARVVADPLDAAHDVLVAGRAAAVAVSSPPSPEQIARLALAARAAPRSLCLAIVSDPEETALAVGLLSDAGCIAVKDVGPLVAVLAIDSLGLSEPWTATTRQLPAVDRARLSLATTGATTAIELQRHERGLSIVSGDLSQNVGSARDLAQALTAMRDASGPAARPASIVEGVDPDAVLDVIFGPPRALSDPASKTALAPYGIPSPVSELCTSPTRAAAEATRIGFPVRIALASPDLRIWDHPDLAIDGVDSAARVRDAFRQLSSMGRSRDEDARILGATVTATTAARALLQLRLRPLPDGLVLGELGFSDPHGIASDDRTCCLLPAPPERVERALLRLDGAGLLLDGPSSWRRAVLQGLTDVLLRLSAFVHDRREEVVSVEIDPLALLVGGGFEVREACVSVGDAFVRTLDASVGGR